jgi:hypothetical protein
MSLVIQIGNVPLMLISQAGKSTAIITDTPLSARNMILIGRDHNTDIFLGTNW